MEIDLNKVIKDFTQNINTLMCLLEGLSEEQLRWRPNENSWSILEVVGHFLDEEKLDFRLRIQSTFEDPNKKWYSYDPEGLVYANKYNEQDFEKTLNDFLEERMKSLTWLKSLENPNWDLIYSLHPAGNFTTGELLCSWLAHDWLHFEQILKLKVLYLKNNNPKYPIRYSGFKE